MKKWSKSLLIRHLLNTGLTVFLNFQVLKKMRDIIGFNKGDSILAPGGSISNLYGLLCARHKFFPDYKTKGSHAINQEKIAIYTSAQVSTSITQLP